MRALVFTLLAAWSAVSAAATPTEKPPLPYYDWKACPFECCTYRRWKAEKSVVAYKTRNQKAEVAFRVEKGEWVRGIDGVVITHRYGVTKVLKQMELGYTKRGDKPVLSLQPGELVYTLHYLGEGSELFWYKGQVYSDQISAGKPDPDPPPPELNVQVLSLPKYTWWAKITNKAGDVGWTNEAHKFGNVDACG